MTDTPETREPTKEELDALIKAKRGEFVLVDTPAPKPAPTAVPRCRMCWEEYIRGRLCACERQDLAEWEEDVRKAKIERLRASSELPKRLFEMTFESFDARVSESAREAYAAALAYVEAYPEHGGEGLAFTGGVGCGKTHLLSATVRGVIAKGAPALFVTVPTLLERMRESYRDDDSLYVNWLRRAQEADFLALDDLGAEKPSDWVSERLFALVNHRYSEGLPTCLTSNLTPDALAGRVGDRVVSRLAQMCRWLWIDAPDRRSLA